MESTVDVQQPMSDNVSTIFILLVVFQMKHFVADFPLQFGFMVVAKARKGWDFAPALALHCAVHMIFTLCITLVINPRLWWLSLVDFATHFIMDRIKSGPRFLGRFDNVERQPFWICFGFDQMVHHLTSYFIIYQLVSQTYF